MKNFFLEFELIKDKGKRFLFITQDLKEGEEILRLVLHLIKIIQIIISWVRIFKKKIISHVN